MHNSPEKKKEQPHFELTNQRVWGRIISKDQAKYLQKKKLKAQNESCITYESL
mgnify:CR=1 FL=1